jgi:hypothetical protein
MPCVESTGASDVHLEQDPQFDLQLEEINREGRRRMDEMMRENEELVEQFGAEHEPLWITGFGGD